MMIQINPVIRKQPKVGRAMKLRKVWVVSVKTDETLVDTNRTYGNLT